MNPAWLILIPVCNLCAAEITIKIDVPTNVVVTITLTTNSTPVQTVAVVPPDARGSLPRSIPMPPMLPPVPVKDKDGQVKTMSFMRPKELPGGTNHHSYGRYLKWQEERVAQGRRRSE